MSSLHSVGRYEPALGEQLQLSFVAVFALLYLHRVARSAARALFGDQESPSAPHRDLGSRVNAGA